MNHKRRKMDWTRVTERMPEMWDRVLATDGHRVFIAYWWGCTDKTLPEYTPEPDWHIGDREFHVKVIAWMPLPAPLRDVVKEIPSEAAGQDGERIKEQGGYR